MILFFQEAPFTLEGSIVLAHRGVYSALRPLRVSVVLQLWQREGTLLFEPRAVCSCHAAPGQWHHSHHIRWFFVLGENLEAFGIEKVKAPTQAKLLI